MNLTGIHPVVPTPFEESGAVDFESIERLVDFMLGVGVDGLLVLGALGEAHKLTPAERSEVIAAFRDALPGDKALSVGVRAPASDPAVAMAVEAGALGADALLVGPPAVQNDEAIAGYYARVAAAVGVPLILHDIPQITGITMTPELIARIHQESDGVEYIKLEDPPTVVKMDRIRALAGESLRVLGALGGLYALEELQRGAVGIMTGFAYPELLVELYARHRDGDVAGAALLFYDFLPLNRWEFQPGIGIHLRKEVLVRRGVFRSATVRHPGPTADPRTLEQLFRIVAHLRDKGYDLEM